VCRVSCEQGPVSPRGETGSSHFRIEPPRDDNPVPPLGNELATWGRTPGPPPRNVHPSDLAPHDELSFRSRSAHSIAFPSHPCRTAVTTPWAGARPTDPWRNAAQIQPAHAWRMTRPAFARFVAGARRSRQASAPAAETATNEPARGRRIRRPPLSLSIFPAEWDDSLMLNRVRRDYCIVRRYCTNLRKSKVPGCCWPLTIWGGM
jgi:hypothetical protein